MILPKLIKCGLSILEAFFHMIVTMPLKNFNKIHISICSPSEIYYSWTLWAWNEVSISYCNAQTSVYGCSMVHSLDNTISFTNSVETRKGIHFVLYSTTIEVVLLPYTLFCRIPLWRISVDPTQKLLLNITELCNKIEDALNI